MTWKKRPALALAAYEQVLFSGDGDGTCLTQINGADLMTISWTNLSSGTVARRQCQRGWSDRGVSERQSNGQNDETADEVQPRDILDDEGGYTQCNCEWVDGFQHEGEVHRTFLCCRPDYERALQQINGYGRGPRDARQPPGKS